MLFLLGIIISILIFFSFSEKEILNSILNKYNNSTLFIGDSHIQTAIDDKILNNGINISQDAESYIFSFYKIKELLNNNSSIKKIYLGFSYNNLSSTYDDYIFGKYSESISSRYFFILPYNLQGRFLIYNIKGLPAYLTKLLKTGQNNLLSEDTDYSFLGRYDNNFTSSKASKESISKRIKFLFYQKQEKPVGFSEFNIFYLMQISDLCKKQNVELIMLNTPLHSHFKSKVPLSYINRYNEIIKDNRLKLLDLSDFALEDDSFTPDGDHLSEKGSIIVSNYLKENNL